MEKMPEIYWIDLNKFDTKNDKSTWLEMSEILIKNGFKVTLLCGYKYNKEKYPSYKVRIKYLSSIAFSPIYRFILLFRAIFYLLQKAKPKDLIIVDPPSLPAGYILKYFKRCHIHLDIRSPAIEVHGIKNNIIKLLFWSFPLYLFIRIPSSYSFISEQLKCRLETGFNTRFKNHLIWHSGVNTRMFQNITLSKKQKSSKFNLLYQGSLSPNRGIDLMIKSLALLKNSIKKNIMLSIAGGGPYLNIFKKMAFELGLAEHIHFTGFIPYEKMPLIIQSADCCICPLPDLPEWNVSSPLKVFEYLACGKPIILTPIAAHKQIITNHDFIIWTKGFSPADFSTAIEMAYCNQHVLAESAGKFAINNAKYYDWELQGNKFANYLKTERKKEIQSIKSKA